MNDIPKKIVSSVDLWIKILRSYRTFFVDATSSEPDNEFDKAWFDGFVEIIEENNGEYKDKITIRHDNGKVLRFTLCAEIVDEES